MSDERTTKPDAVDTTPAGAVDDPSATPVIPPSERLKRIAAIIEEGDRRLQFRDGPCGGLPPELSLDEWREMYLLAIGETSERSGEASEDTDASPPAG